MVKKSFYIIILFLTGACTEPYSFDIASELITVVDAKVSNRVGETYVEIVLENNGEQTAITDYNVSLFSGSGQQIDLSYSEDEGRYLPDDTDFSAITGEKYRMEASGPGGEMITSGYDSIPDLPDFGILLSDTTVLSEDPADNTIIISRGAVLASATFNETPRVFYARLNFTYKYEDFWSGDSVEVDIPDEFVLFSSNEVLENTTVPVGSKPKRETWIFFDESRPPEICVGQLGTDGQCGDPCCGNPCCQFELVWPVNMVVNVEMLSESSFSYWEDLDRLRGSDGLIFDSFPFPLEGNITCESCPTRTVVGFFRAVAEDSRQRRISI